MTDSNTDKRVYLYDSTLRDGAQTQGVDFNVNDKIAIALALDELGIDYVEGGWPGANPTDDAFFAEAPKLAKAKLAAFGMTRRPGRSAENDPGLTALLGTKARVVTMVGKTWDFQVEVALGIENAENVAMITDSITLAGAKVDEVMFDAEHFFDGYKANPSYALECVTAAHGAGARWVVLCDTNGGTLPDEVEEIVSRVAKEIPGTSLGIHCHNDTENAVANSLAAVRAGARQIQGTLNGLGSTGRPTAMPPMSARPPSPIRGACMFRRWKRIPAVMSTCRPNPWAIFAISWFPIRRGGPTSSPGCASST
jgi:2-isopropylmalate synthase